MWKDRKQGGYAHDWEFVSRWAKEKHAFTLLPTVLYNISTNMQTWESILWIVGEPRDQHSLREMLKMSSIEEVKLDNLLDRDGPSKDAIALIQGR